MSDHGRHIISYLATTGLSAAGLVLGASVGAVRDLRIMLRDLSDKGSSSDDRSP